MRNFNYTIAAAVIVFTAGACMAAEDSVSLEADLPAATQGETDSASDPQDTSEPKEVDEGRGESDGDTDEGTTPEGSRPSPSTTNPDTDENDDDNSDETDVSLFDPNAGQFQGLQTLWISAEWTECMTMIPVKCPKVAMAEGEEPTGNPIHIEGFEIEEGTSYVVTVEVTKLDNPPADGSSLRYKFAELISSS